MGSKERPPDHASYTRFDNTSIALLTAIYDANDDTAMRIKVLTILPLYLARVPHYTVPTLVQKGENHPDSRVRNLAMFFRSKVKQPLTAEDVYRWRDRFSQYDSNDTKAVEFIRDLFAVPDPLALMTTLYRDSDNVETRRMLFVILRPVLARLQPGDLPELVQLGLKDEDPWVRIFASNTRSGIIPGEVPGSERE